MYRNSDISVNTKLIAGANPNYPPNELVFIAAFWISVFIGPLFLLRCHLPHKITLHFSVQISCLRSFQMALETWELPLAYYNYKYFNTYEGDLSFICSDKELTFEDHVRYPPSQHYPCHMFPSVNVIVGFLFL